MGLSHMLEGGSRRILGGPRLYNKSSTPSLARAVGKAGAISYPESILPWGISCPSPPAENCLLLNKRLLVIFQNKEANQRPRSVEQGC